MPLQNSSVIDTLLQLTVRLNRVEAVRLLLDYGADVNALSAVLVPTHEQSGQPDPDPNELLPRTALQAAIELGDLQLIDMLFAVSAVVNGSWAQDAGATALQLAAAKGHLGVVRRLLSLGAHVDARRAEISERTALESAAEQGRLDTVQFLLEVGSKTTGDWGRWQYPRAIGFAMKNGRGSVKSLLRDWREWDV